MTFSSSPKGTKATCGRTNRYVWPLIVVLVYALTQCRPPLPSGDADNGGLILPGGFEALVVAKELGRARHLAVNTNGDIYVKLRYPDEDGENVALRDTDNDGRADIIKRFGVYDKDGTYGTAMRIYDGYLYFSTAGRVIRHKLKRGQLVPDSEPEVMLVDDYKNAEFGYEHIAKPITFDDQGHMFVPFGAPGDVCQEDNRKPGSPGLMPCPELEWHGGLWQFDAHRPGQTQQDGYRYATGIRSIVGMTWNPANRTIYALQHGRDNLHSMWPHLYSRWESAMLPSEEFFMIEEGTDAGWPYYYYDQIQGKKLLNPEYGGDKQKQGDALDYEQPIIGFPGHWAPNDILFYQGDQFPERYRGGAFIAFHGSTIRNPYPQAGYFVAFVPFEGGQKSGDWEVFANGFAQLDTIFNTSDAKHRPVGLAEGPDGSLYISDSQVGTIWRIVFKGDREAFGDAQLAHMEEQKMTPNVKTPDEVEDDLSKGREISGSRVYETYCRACHARNGKGDGTRFPPIDSSEWVMGDKETLIRIVLEGLEGPITVRGEQFLGTMPAMPYLTDQEVAEVLTYIRQNFNNEGDAVSEGEVSYVRSKLDPEQI